MKVATRAGCDTRGQCKHVHVASIIPCEFRLLDPIQHGKLLPPEKIPTIPWGDIRNMEAHSWKEGYAGFPPQKARPPRSASCRSTRSISRDILFFGLHSTMLLSLPYRGKCALSKHDTTSRTKTKHRREPTVKAVSTLPVYQAIKC